jgi:hypothetical protein
MAEEISPLENHGWWMQQLRKDAKANRPEALRLAQELDAYHTMACHKQAAAELRRLHAVNAELLEALRVFVSCSLPVSTEIDERGHRWTEAYLDQALPIARAAIARAEGEQP